MIMMLMCYSCYSFIVVVVMMDVEEGVVIAITSSFAKRVLTVCRFFHTTVVVSQRS